MKRRVVITGLGAVTPLGLTMAETWQGVQAGRCGIGPITHYDASAQKVHLAAEVKGSIRSSSLAKRRPAAWAASPSSRWLPPGRPRRTLH